MTTKAGRGPEVDDAVLQRARAGDGAAFAVLLRCYDPGLRALAFRLLGDAGRMDDVLQEAYLKAYRSLSRFEGGSAVGTWLYRIVYNACINDILSRARRPVIHLEDEGVSSVPGNEEQVSDRGVLARALELLPED